MNKIPVTYIEFNDKYKNYLKEGHYGLAFTLDSEKMKILDKKFQEFIKRPGFSYSQIKQKFGMGRFHAEKITTEEQNEIENLVTDDKLPKAQIVRITPNRDGK